MTIDPRIEWLENGVTRRQVLRGAVAGGVVLDRGRLAGRLRRR